MAKLRGTSASRQQRSGHLEQQVMGHVAAGIARGALGEAEERSWRQALRGSRCFSRTASQRGLLVGQEKDV